MITIYFTQAWMLIKQHKLFTSIYVIGTGLSVALTMTMFIIFYVKFAPIYPEYNRDRTVVVKTMKRYPKDNAENWNCNYGVSYYMATDLLKGLPHLETVGALARTPFEDLINMPDSKEMLPVKSLYVDQGFWHVFTFRYLSGKPFTQTDVDASLPVAVLSESLATRIFASTEVVGNYFTMNGRDFRVVGVVEDASSATPDSAADLWVPLFLNQWVAPDKDGTRLLGNVHLYITAPTVDEKELLKEEIRDAFRKYNLVSKEYEHDLMQQPDDYWKSTFRVDAVEAPNWNALLKSLLYMLLALLFIPAMNLSGMISSRMDHRLGELGVRKAYGATNFALIGQVLWENLFLTCMGGVIGLLLSYLIILTANEWILTLFDQTLDITQKAPFFSFEMLFNPMIFGFAFGMCVLLNLISALIPTVWALRRTIVQSLSTKR